MTWSVLQSASSAATTGAATKAVTYGSNVSSGTKLIAYVSVSSGVATTVSTVKDGAGNSFAQVKAQANGSSQNTSAWQLDTPAGDVGTKPTITATASTGTPEMAILAEEVSALATGTTNAAVIDGTPGGGTGTGGASTGSPTYSSAASGEFLVAVYGDDGGPETVTQPSGYTLDSNSVNSDSHANIAVAYKNSAGGTEAGSWALTGTSADWSALLFAFKPAAGPAFTASPSRPHGQAVNRASTY